MPDAILGGAIVVTVVFATGFILSAYAQHQLFKTMRDL